MFNFGTFSDGALHRMCRALSKLDDQSLFCVYSYHMTALELIGACLASGTSEHISQIDDLFKELSRYAQACLPNIEMKFFTRKAHHHLSLIKFSDAERKVVIGVCVTAINLINRQLKFSKVLVQSVRRHEKNQGINTSITYDKYRVARGASVVDNMMKARDMA